MAVDGLKEAYTDDSEVGEGFAQVIFHDIDANPLLNPEDLLKERAVLNQKLSDIRVKYWAAKNRCSCYTMTYGEYDDKQMLHWAREAYNLGRSYDKIKKKLRELEMVVSQVFSDNDMQIDITFTIKSKE